MQFSMKLAMVFALAMSCAANVRAADIFILDDLDLDSVVAGRALTGIQVTARTGVDDLNFSDAYLRLFLDGSAEGATSATCQPPCQATGTLLWVGAVPGSTLRQEAERLGEFPQPDGVSYGAYGLGDEGINQIDAGAFGPTGSADARVKFFPVVQSDVVSATVGIGRGQTSGDGQVAVTGVVGEGRGIGQGYAIQTPFGDQLLFGIAIAVDPGAIVAAR
ncbi:MAG: hypothetical protein H6852_11415 [Geminicoccaceae bacterium]|nr:hypothetical protein [Geminicoccaceae bacterium]HRY24123.1 hypothetical protein [Geminicoccaceae bacterium]